ncbi:MAG TPA: alpha/beta fold hydrolase [Pirellulales bacterium]|nr:alpha/beta fold hydrolase [Pirellulales bacterium]
MIADVVSQFRPHPLLRGGHVQTLAGAYLPGPRFAYAARQHAVSLPDGDQIVLHDDLPQGWQPGGRAALLIHGLGGCHLSPYMQRIAAKLQRRGVRSFRMDLRGCGAGITLARLPYHSGRSEDAAAALETMAVLCPGSPVALVGFSLGGNIALKLLGELTDQPCGHLDRAVAVCPPADLTAAIGHISRPRNRLYERHFLRRLIGQVRRRRKLLPDLPGTDWPQTPRRLWEFDDVYTAPVSGFGRADEYYRRASSLRVRQGIRRPALVIASRDDPLVPVNSLEPLADCPAVQLEIVASGGHLGFVGRRQGADRRWLDWRIVEWVADEGVSGPAPGGSGNVTVGPIAVTVT